MNYNLFKKEVHDLAVEKGWYDKKREMKELVFLVKSELFEAFEEYRKGNFETYYEDKKPCGFYVELADISIRALDIAGFYNVDVKTDDYSHHKNSCFIIDWFDYMDEFMRSYKNLTKSEYVTQILCDIENFCFNKNVDIHKIILEKHRYNKTRSKRHGGKIC